MQIVIATIKDEDGRVAALASMLQVPILSKGTNAARWATSITA